MNDSTLPLKSCILQNKPKEHHNQKSAKTETSSYGCVLVNFFFQKCWCSSISMLIAVIYNWTPANRAFADHFAATYLGKIAIEIARIAKSEAGHECVK